MIGTNPECPAGIFLMADHLDTVLAAGEDMLAMSLAPRADLDEADPETAPEAADRFAAQLRKLELSVLARVLQCRRRIDDLGQLSDPALRSAISLFKAQTAVLAELVSSGDRSAEKRFDGAGDNFAFLRSRGLIPPEAAAPSPFESVEVGESYRLGGVVPLGPLLDLVSALLDLLDARYGLYKTDLDEPAMVREAAPGSDGEASELHDVEAAAIPPAEAVPKEPAEAGDGVGGPAIAGDADDAESAVAQAAPSDNVEATVAASDAGSGEIVQGCASSGDGDGSEEPESGARDEASSAEAASASDGNEDAKTETDGDGELRKHRSLMSAIAEIGDAASPS